MEVAAGMGSRVRRGGVVEPGQSYPTSYGTGPPESTITKDRSIHPSIHGSTGGFIGLISGIAVVVIAFLFGGYYLWNRHRRRLLTQAKGKSTLPRISPSKGKGTPSLGLGLPSFSLSRPSAGMDDPYADPIVSPHKNGRPSYARQRSEEWELPDELEPYNNNNSYSSTPTEDPDSEAARLDGSQGANRLGSGTWGKREDPSRGFHVQLPDQPAEAASPLRSRSPRLSATNLSLDETSRPSSRLEETKLDKGKGKATEDDVEEGESLTNPFSSPYDDGRLSPRMAHREL